MSYHKLISFLVGMLVFTHPAVALAYLDPGSGSIILQAVIAAVIGAAVTLKLYWLRVRAFFASLFSRTDSPAKQSDPEQDTTKDS